MVENIKYLGVALLYRIGETEKLENGVWSSILGTPEYTSIAARQEAVAVSSTESRDIK